MGILDHQKIIFTAIEGTPLWDESFTTILATLLEDKIEFKCMYKNNAKPLYLKYEQINNVEVASNFTKVDRKNPVLSGTAKGAIAGGLVLNPAVGAIIGAIDGTQRKKKRKFQQLFIIYYTSSEGEMMTLPLEIANSNTAITIGINGFKDELIKRCSNYNSGKKETYL